MVALSVPCQTKSHTTLLTQDGPGGAQEGSKRGFIFFFRSWGRPWGRKGGSKSGFRRESLRQDVDLDTIMSKMGAIIMKKLPKCAKRCPKMPTRP